MGERWKLKGQRNRLGDAGTNSLTPSTDDADVSVDGDGGGQLRRRWRLTPSGVLQMPGQEKGGLAFFARGCPLANDIRTENTLVFTRRRWLPICSPQHCVCFPLCIYVWSIMSNRQCMFWILRGWTKWYCDTRHRDADETEDDEKQREAWCIQTVLSETSTAF